MIEANAAQGAAGWATEGEGSVRIAVRNACSTGMAFSLPWMLNILSCRCCIAAR